MNQRINVRLNKQPNLLGKINPTYVLSYIFPALVLKQPKWGCCCFF